MTIIDLTRCELDALGAHPDPETAAGVIVTVNGQPYRLYAHQARELAAELCWAALEAEGDAPAGWPNRPPAADQYRSVNDPDAGRAE